jgi:hypothetical protein
MADKTKMDDIKWGDPDQLTKIMQAERERLGINTVQYLDDVDTRSRMEDVTLAEVKMKVSPTYTSTGTFTTRSTLSRRRQIGDTSRIIDVPGFWAHIESTGDGLPRSPTLIEVNDDMTEWRIVGETTARIMDRLPKAGLFFFLW